MLSGWLQHTPRSIRVAEPESHGERNQPTRNTLKIFLTDKCLSLIADKVDEYYYGGHHRSDSRFPRESSFFFLLQILVALLKYISGTSQANIFFFAVCFRKQDSLHNVNSRACLSNRTKVTDQTRRSLEVTLVSLITRLGFNPSTLSPLSVSLSPSFPLTS